MFLAVMVVYSFDTRGDGNGGAKLFKFDCNLKESKYSLADVQTETISLAHPYFMKALFT